MARKSKEKEFVELAKTFRFIIGDEVYKSIIAKMESVFSTLQTPRKKGRPKARKDCQGWVSLCDTDEGLQLIVKKLFYHFGTNNAEMARVVLTLMWLNIFPYPEHFKTYKFSYKRIYNIICKFKPTEKVKMPSYRAFIQEINDIETEEMRFPKDERERYYKTLHPFAIELIDYLDDIYNFYDVMYK